MQRRFLATLAGVLSAAILSIALPAEALMVMAGEQDFEDGVIIGFASDYNDEQANEEGPFSGMIGSDPFGPSFSATWDFSFDPETEMDGAVLRFGMYDGDGQADGNQVGSFTVDGMDLTALMNDVFESTGGAQNQYSVYTISLPADVLVALTDGAVSIALALEGPGISPFGDTNGAGLDFSSLEMGVVAPEPSAILLSLLGIFALAAARPGRRC